MLGQPGRSGGLLVDLYHIDAAYIAWRSGITAAATFDLYTRHAPFGGGYLLVAGLEPALAFVADFAFDDEDIAFLRSLRPYNEAFLASLRQTRFTGEIQAIPEGTVAFPNEPLARVTAPFIEALLVESGLLHIIGVSTLIATKASRIVHAAAGKPVAEFGYRRAQEPFLAARSGYIGGCMSTSFVAAAAKFGIPASGTVPHALIEVFPTEADAFRAVAEALDHYSLLLDTYDVENAIRTAAEIAIEVHARLGHRLSSVRLDSGDLSAGSRLVRTVLNNAGLHEVRVLASGDLDEWRIAELIEGGAPIDGFGVGTSLAVGSGSAEHRVDGGALGAVYKLAWYEGTASRARIKIAGEKSTWPGKKQVVRTGEYCRDLIQLENEPYPADSTPLLIPVVKNGEQVVDDPALVDIRDRAHDSLKALPERFRELKPRLRYPVEFSPALFELRAQAIAEFSSASTEPRPLE